MAVAVDIPCFRTVAFDYGQIHVRGGSLAKALPMTCKTIRVNGDRGDGVHRGDGGTRDAATNKIFVKMCTREHWLVRATTGAWKSNASAIGRTTLLDILHNKVLAASNGELELISLYDPAAVAADEDTGEHDPMDDLSLSPVSPPAAKQRKVRSDATSNRTRYYGNAAKKSVCYTSAPAVPPEEDPTSTAERRITLYIADRLTVWLALEDVAWAVKFLYVQNVLKGVPMVDADDAGPSGVPHGAPTSRGDGNAMLAGNQPGEAESRGNGAEESQVLSPC
jgi:hypothetical protein